MKAIEYEHYITEKAAREGMQKGIEQGIKQGMARFEKLILTCAGGCMRELLWQMEELNKQEAAWEVLGYVDPADRGTIFVGNQGYPYLGDDEYLLSLTEDTNVAVCAGDTKLRKKIAEKLMRNPHLKFPNLILSDTRVCSDVRMGQGCILSMDSRISTNVVLGDFVFLNTGAMVCHDGSVGSFTTLGPDVKLAGSVTVGKGCNLGLGTKAIQGITVGDDVITGAGSVIIRNVPDACTVVGVPTRRVTAGAPTRTITVGVPTRTAAKE